MGIVELIPVLEAEGSDEEEAAALMGAGGWTIFWKITFPHIKWALLYGVVLCTARAMGEFGWRFACQVADGAHLLERIGVGDAIARYVGDRWQSAQ